MMKKRSDLSTSEPEMDQEPNNEDVRQSERTIRGLKLLGFAAEGPEDLLCELAVSRPPRAGQGRPLGQERDWDGIRKNPPTQQVEFRAAVHLPLHQFQPTSLAFHLAVAPRQDNGGGDRLFVAAQSVTETPDFRQARSSCLLNPGLQGFILLVARHGGGALCQIVENRDFRAALVQFGE